MASKITSYMTDMKEKETLDEVKAVINAGRDPMEIVEELRDGISEVGDKFEKQEVFLTELIMAAEIFKEAMKLIKPKIEEKKLVSKEIGTLVIGTVQGDLHDVGKNIFGSLMDASGFVVHDLGVDVTPEMFVEAIKKYDANLVGMSALLSAGLYVMDDTIKAIENAGLREKVKILIGGGIAGEELTSKMLKADAFTEFASVGVKLAKRFVGVES